ncbi:acetyltransferase [Bradyrhizobium niftali]|jgi:UDP-perosamine 4-acetyltransferase|uniref:Acetyltransferase n=1 Tax=Bradyrhizobium niftali TaxID=2560055 RepID=A0A4Y9LSD9_9BRAD|nr:acetyltransferase [Bradyrhizobium niftali]TFV45859.1 acetyltransferase [Bradyrhizobium niftali]
MAKAYIFGAGGHARVIASFLDVAPVFVVQSLEGQAALPGSMMSEDDYFRELPLGDAYLGIGANAARDLCASRLRAAKVNMPPCIAPTAFVARDAEIESGAVIGAGAVIGSRALIGRDTIVNTLSSVDHDCILGALSQVTVGVTFGGGVRVGANCFFGMKSGVFPNRIIGDNVQVMAGSLISTDVEPNVMMGGNPAQLVKRIA